MKKLAAALAAAVAMIAVAGLSGAAFAGGHHPGGDHKSGSLKQQQDSQAAGQKPGPHTDHNTSCTTGGGNGSSATCQSGTSTKPDASKQYGNGKTAAQIANGKGAPSGTTITGPGNSQPHKICGRDVHAYKGGDCSQQQHGQEQPKPPKPQQQSQQTVTFCDMSSATSGDLETKSADEVARHEFDGNPEENRDIVPPFTYGGKTYSENWDSNGQAIFNAHCNASSGVQGTTTTVTTPPPSPKMVYVCHATGSATNPYVLIHISINGWIHGHSHHQDGRDILLGDKPGPCPTGKTSATTTVAATTTTNAATTTTTVATTTTTAAAAATTTTVAAAAASSSTPTPPPSPASGVKGASKTIVAPASHRPSHGVLGVAKTLGSSATSGTLPFTGLRLWIVELVALGLIGGGVAMRLIARRRFNS
jgi:hypothetical protein